MTTKPLVDPTPPLSGSGTYRDSKGHFVKGNSFASVKAVEARKRLETFATVLNEEIEQMVDGEMRRMTRMEAIIRADVMEAMAHGGHAARERVFRYAMVPVERFVSKEDEEKEDLSVTVRLNRDTTNVSG